MTKTSTGTRAARLAVLLVALGLLGSVTVHGINETATLEGGGKARTSSDPLILINNNASLEAAASAGNGTAGNPFIIENKIIDVSSNTSSHGIDISNTDAHLIIRNCTVTGASMYQHGISLASVRNVKILDNNVSMNGNGVNVIDSTSIVIEGNIFDNNSLSGVFTQACNDTTVTGNVARHNGNNGFYSLTAINHIFSANLATHNGEAGIFISGFRDNVITANVLAWNGKGVSLSGCNSSLVQGNNASWNVGSGISLQTSHDNNIYDNVFDDNFQSVSDVHAAIFLFAGSSGNTIQNNTISRTRAWGLFLSGDTSGTTVTGNTFIDNEAGCIKDQGAGNIVHGNTCSPEPPIHGFSTWWLVCLSGVAVVFVIATRKNRHRG